MRRAAAAPSLHAAAAGPSAPQLLCQPQPLPKPAGSGSGAGAAGPSARSSSAARSSRGDTDQEKSSSAGLATGPSPGSNPAVGGEHSEEFRWSCEKVSTAKSDRGFRSRPALGSSAGVEGVRSRGGLAAQSVGGVGWGAAIGGGRSGASHGRCRHSPAGRHVKHFL